MLPVFADAPGRATLIDNHQVYYRPPANYLEDPATLLAVLRKLLVRPVRESATPEKNQTAPVKTKKVG